MPSVPQLPDRWRQCSFSWQEIPRGFKAPGWQQPQARKLSLYADLERKCTARAGRPLTGTGARGGRGGGGPVVAVGGQGGPLGALGGVGRALEQGQGHRGARTVQGRRRRRRVRALVRGATEERMLQRMVRRDPALRRHVNM